VPLGGVVAGQVGGDLLRDLGVLGGVEALEGVALMRGAVGAVAVEMVLTAGVAGVHAGDPADHAAALVARGLHLGGVLESLGLLGFLLLLLVLQPLGLLLLLLDDGVGDA